MPAAVYLPSGTMAQQSALRVQLPQRDLGGRLPPWNDLAAQLAWGREHGAAERAAATTDPGVLGAVFHVGHPSS
jgi:hypothetical protein